MDLSSSGIRELPVKNVSSEPTVIRRQLDGRTLIIVDGLFRADFINLFDYFLRRLSFSLGDYDAEDSGHVLHWIHEFSIADIATQPLLSFVFARIRSTAETECPEPRVQLKRVHCNTSLYGDIQFPHHDITPGMTWLYYSNLIWKPTWMGETIFYDLHAEPVYAVFPKPGRVVIFAADILHRGGVPSRECTEARRTLVFKFLNENK